MKRSEINQIINDSIAFLESKQFLLPPFAQWTPDDWKARGPESKGIVDEQLGWDLTDFGSGDFKAVGLAIFAIRNGLLENYDNGGKVYGEKVLIVQENQVTPTHYHAFKMEDIINRGGGELCIQLWNTNDDGTLDEEGDVTLSIDSTTTTFRAGHILKLAAGESVCLPPRLAHMFWGTPDKGTVLVGEVSKINDDHSDNFFIPEVGRFPGIEEDEAPVRLLVGDYGNYYAHA